MPIKLRVTLAFTLVMAVVLVAVGLLIYSRQEAQLNESIDTGLRSRATEVSALVRASGTALSGSGQTSLIEQDESFAEVMTLGGRVVDSTPQIEGEPLLDSADLSMAARGATFFEQGPPPGLEGSVRMLAAPVADSGRRVIVIVGSSLGDRNEALSSLRSLLFVGGAAALLLASLAGYGVAALSLRPVDAMRRRAGEISAKGPGERLPVPAGNDELSRLGATLNAMLSRLEAAIERERRFVDDASHELRTPLALHKTELELALRYAADADELRAAIGSAVVEIDRLVQLAEDLLVVARSEEGGLALTVAPVSLPELFETVSERFRARAAQAGRTIEVDADGISMIVGDRLRLEQALTSIVDNALRHGGGDIQVWARSNGSLTELHVADAGTGFPPDFLARAFERFSQADTARTGAGSGLGLAIVETIARAHGGTAHAANAPGGGADVWMEVPSRPDTSSGPAS
jgi:two-component system, OmpR family, sensor kinase